MRLFILIIIIFLGFTANAENEETRKKIAILDTGLDVTPGIIPYLCKGKLHKDFLGVAGTAFEDISKIKHGTNIASIYAQYVDPLKYCLVIYTVLYPRGYKKRTYNYVPVAVWHSIKIGAVAINMSMAGADFHGGEFAMLHGALERKIKIAVAAGNEKTNLDKECSTYPACYALLLNDNQRYFRPIGSSTGSYSNYGKFIKFWVNGTNRGYPPLSGTSQATAVYMAKYWLK